MSPLEDQPLGRFRTRSFPYLFTIVLLGLITASAMAQAFAPGQYQSSAQYLLIVLGGFWLIFIFHFVNEFTELTIYTDKIVLQQVFLRVKDEILFSDIAGIKINNRILRHEDNQSDSYLLFVGESRTSTLQFITADDQELAIPISDYNDEDKILKLLAETELAFFQTRRAFQKTIDERL